MEQVTKKEFFLRALNNGAYRRKAWAIRCFSEVNEPEEAFADDPFPYRPFVYEGVVRFIPEEAPMEPIQISDLEPARQPWFRFDEKIKLKAGEAPNLFEDVETTYGNLFFNFYVLVHAFGNKFPFQSGKIKAKTLEGMIEKKLEDDVPEGEELETRFYVHEYKRFAEAMYALTGFSQLCVPSATAKTMTTDPKVREVREKLLKKYEGRLHDPAVVARIEAELIEIDKAWMEGDDGADFYIKAKSYNNVRKKAHLMHGFESGFSEDGSGQLVSRSLAEGWDYDKLPAMVNSLREGSFNRGAMTELGGVATKEAFRAFQNASIAEKDCGSTLGITRIPTEKDINRYVGFYHLKAGKPVEITEENATSLVGKDLILRTPMLCKTGYTDFCEVCMGKQNSRNPTGLGALAAAVGSTFMTTFMKKMHVSSLSLARYDYRSSIT